MVPLINVSIKLFLIFLFVVTYLITIIKSFLKLLEIRDCICCLSNYLSSAKIGKWSFDNIGFQLNKNESYQQRLSEALFKFPVIQKYTGYYSGSLEYGASDAENYKVAADIYNNLLMKRNYIFQDFKSSFNPIHTLKTIFTFPSKIFIWVGFNPSEVASRVINLIGWIVSYLIGIYSSEIKELITGLINKLSN